MISNCDASLSLLFVFEYHESLKKRQTWTRRFPNVVPCRLRVNHLFKKKFMYINNNRKKKNQRQTLEKKKLFVCGLADRCGGGVVQVRILGIYLASSPPPFFFLFLCLICMYTNSTQVFNTQIKSSPCLSIYKNLKKKRHEKKLEGFDTMKWKIPNSSSWIFH